MEHAFQLMTVIPLLCAGGWQAFVKATPRYRRHFLGTLAGLGWGGAKLGFAQELTLIFQQSFHAAPVAVSGWSTFVSMMSFGLGFYLTVSGVGDALDGLARLLGRSCPPLLSQPFWAASWRDFWGRWGVPSAESTVTFRDGCLRCAWFLVSVCIWSGYRSGMGSWMILQMLLLKLDSWLDRRCFWQTRIPHGLKSLLITGLFILTLPLLYSGGLQAALEEWSHLFFSPFETFNSALLRARLSTSQVIWILWLGVAFLFAPSVSWILNRGARWRHAVVTAGIVLLIMVSLIFIAHLSLAPVSVRRLGLQLHQYFHPDGNAVVSIGSEGWLYPRAEVDRMTQKRPDGAGLLHAVLELHSQIHAHGATLLVLPVPDKIMLRPEPLLPGNYPGPIYPPGYHEALKQLRTAGVEILDLAPMLWDQRNRRPLHFHQDSHWRWDGMKEIAIQTARYLRQKHPQVILDKTPLVDATFIDRQDVGDLGHALSVEHTRSPERVQMVGLRGLTGGDSSPVLVVGGELIRVYDDSQLSFGPRTLTDAPTGFPIQLGALIGRAVDTVDEYDLQSLRKQAQGKKLLVWVVRSREL